MREPAIRCRSLSKRFGAALAVAGADLILPAGHILALLGPSGCGKTTMLRLIAGFEAPDAGLIEIAGRTVFGAGCLVPPEKRKVGMVFQDYALFPHLDVFHNVAFGLNGGNGRAARVAEILSLVGLHDLASRMPHELSGGQQQRVALARALAPRPEVVLLDEPFSNLDAGLRAKVRAEVRDILRAAKATAVFVTHDQQEALSLADEVAVMLEGYIVQVDTPEGLYSRPAAKEVAAFVGDADFLPGEIAAGSVRCELGTLSSRESLTGKVELMLRPENVELIHDPSSDCRVAGREFLGHDQVVSVRLASNHTIRARLGPEGRFNQGDHVRIRLRNQVVNVYPPTKPNGSAAPIDQN